MPRYTLIPRSAAALACALTLTRCSEPDSAQQSRASTAAAHESSDSRTPADPCAGSKDLPGVCPGRGLYDAAVSVKLEPAVGDRALHYTLDGSEPTQASPTYSRPIEVKGTAARAVVTLRAASFDSNGERSSIATHSYVFPQYVLDQPARPAGVPEIWGRTGNTRTADYAMDARVLADAADRAAAARGLASIPTLTLNLAHEDLFGPEGLYMNPHRKGHESERAASIELFTADGSESLGTDCGVRVQGGSSTRSWKAAKVSFRLSFRKRYGPGKLEHKLFPDSPVEAFDKLILDAHLSGWFDEDAQQPKRAQYIRDAFASDSQNALGSNAPHSRFVHLYLNGLYWGLYDLHERPDADFAAAYLGGEQNDYDVLKHNGNDVIGGDPIAWQKLRHQAQQGVRDQQDFAVIKRYLDVEDFIDYALLNLYIGNEDWVPHNWYAARPRKHLGGFRFFSWDAEMGLMRLNADLIDVNGDDDPGLFFHALMQYPAFRAQLRARAATVLGPDGVLGPARSRERYARRAREIENAILLESARWGDAVRAEPYTREDWIAERDNLLQNFFPERSARVLAQVYRATRLPGPGGNRPQGANLYKK